MVVYLVIGVLFLGCGIVMFGMSNFVIVVFLVVFYLLFFVNV